MYLLELTPQLLTLILVVWVDCKNSVILTCHRLDWRAIGQEHDTAARWNYRLNLNDFEAKLFAYGNIESSLKPRVAEAKERIAEISGLLAGLPAIEPFLNRNLTPKHPRCWQIEKLIKDMRCRITKTCGQDSGCPAC